MAAYIKGGSLIGSAGGFFGGNGGVVGAALGGATSGGGFTALSGGDAADVAGAAATGWVVGAGSYIAAAGISYGISSIPVDREVVESGHNGYLRRTSLADKKNGPNMYAKHRWVTLGERYSGLSQFGQGAGQGGGIMGANVYLASNNNPWTIINNSTRDVYYLTEDGNGMGKIRPGETLYDYVDGIATMKYKDQILKVLPRWPKFALKGSAKFSKLRRF